MTKSKYDAHTELFSRQLHLLKVKDIFYVQCLKVQYKFLKKKLSYMTSEPKATIGYTYIQPAPVVLAKFWDITYRNY